LSFFLGTKRKRLTIVGCGKMKPLFRKRHVPPPSPALGPAAASRVATHFGINLAIIRLQFQWSKRRSPEPGPSHAQFTEILGNMMKTALTTF
jgi:hypothetical protein